MRIMVASGKGGVGKTMLSANLAVALALRGQRVVVIDGDIGLRNLDMALGLESQVVFDLADVIEGRASYDQALLRHPKVANVYMLPAPQNRLPGELPQNAIAKAAMDLERQYDFVLIDTPAGVGNSFMACADAAQSVIAVTLPEQAALRDCDRVLRIVRGRYPRIFVVINRLQKKAVKRGLQIQPDEIRGILDAPIDAIIPEDMVVMRPLGRMPAAAKPTSKGGAAIRKLAGLILEEKEKKA